MHACIRYVDWLTDWLTCVWLARSFGSVKIKLAFAAVAAAAAAAAVAAAAAAPSNSEIEGEKNTFLQFIQETMFSSMI